LVRSPAPEDDAPGTRGEARTARLGFSQVIPFIGKYVACLKARNEPRRPALVLIFPRRLAACTLNVRSRKKLSRPRSRTGLKRDPRVHCQTRPAVRAVRRVCGNEQLRRMALSRCFRGNIDDFDCHVRPIFAILRVVSDGSGAGWNVSATGRNAETPSGNPKKACNLMPSEGTCSVHRCAYPAD
jgi:hypothetical protein